MVRPRKGSHTLVQARAGTGMRFDVLQETEAPAMPEGQSQEGQTKSNLKEWRRKEVAQDKIKVVGGTGERSRPLILEKRESSESREVNSEGLMFSAVRSADLAAPSQKVRDKSKKGKMGSQKVNKGNRMGSDASSPVEIDVGVFELEKKKGVWAAGSWAQLLL